MPPVDTGYHGFALSVPGGPADPPDIQRVGRGPVTVKYRKRAVAPHNLQRQHVRVKRQRAVKVTTLLIGTE